ncbi:DUF2335 domain-containing protein [uncultured Corynebacterium sp.]|uniref:DUF2335 domain-containing protein n=1 Tax=uncultured Corynebacterium sp. TaxID=159447 RepID=UPI0009F810C8|nr:DUF2335 domain-containing protein [uncultured Corynebacterium sp.]
MANEHSNDAQHDPWQGDSSLQRRSDNSGSTYPRSSGKPGESVEANGAGTAAGDRLSEQDDVLEAEVLDQVSNRVTHDLMSVMRVAPLPHPSELQAYEEVEAGLANRIVAMAEDSAIAANEATRSNAAVNYALAESIREEGRAVRRGQWMFVCLAVLFLAVAVILELLDRTPFATGMGILGFLSLLGSMFIPKKKPQWGPSGKGEESSAR